MSVPSGLGERGGKESGLEVLQEMHNRTEVLNCSIIETIQFNFPQKLLHICGLFGMRGYIQEAPVLSVAISTNLVLDKETRKNLTYLNPS